MTKAELKNGMYVKLRNGMLELKIGDKLVEANGRYNGFLYYDKDLCHNLSSEWDIMEVFVSSSPDIFKTDALERIWERPNDKHVPEVGDLYVKNEDDDCSNDIYLIYRIIDNRANGGSVCYYTINLYSNDLYLQSFYGDDELNNNYDFVKSMPEAAENFKKVIEAMSEANGEI